MRVSTRQQRLSALAVLLMASGSYLHTLERQKQRIEYLESELEDANYRAEEADDLEEQARKTLEILAKADAHMGAGQLLELIEKAVVALGAEG